MNRFSLLPFITLFAAGVAALSSSHAHPFEGSWAGSIATPGPGLQIEVALARVSADQWEGTIDIPIQGIRSYPLAAVSVAGDSVSFAMDGIPGRPEFSGRSHPEEETIAGTFEQGPQSLRFSLKRAKKSVEEASAPGAITGSPGEGATGEWLGALAVGPSRLRIALHIEAAAGDAGLSGSIDSLDQGAMDIRIDRMRFEEGRLEFEIQRIGGSFDGRMSDDGSEIAGVWTQLGNSNPLVFYRQKEAATLRRPQEPQPPFPYEERAVSFRNEAAGLSLSGTLLLPEGEGPFAAVLFVSGSGPQDRDETLMGHRPFRVVADFLARRGIASLRYDDRGFGESEGDHMGSTVQDFAADAWAGLRFLSRQEGIASVGIIGHSEGGLTGPMVANTDAPLDFLVLLAPPAERMDLLLTRQLKEMSRLQGLEESLIERVAADQEEDMELVKDAALDGEELQAALRESWKRNKPTYSPEELILIQGNDQQIEQSIQLVSTPWFRSLVRIDPVVFLERVTVPTLALFGENDVQVSAAVNARLLREALRAAGNADFRIEVREGLNHLFQTSETGAVEEYAHIAETFEPATLEIIADWIRERF